MRVLVTGSRDVPDAAWQMIRAALVEAVGDAPGPHTLVHGGARGADRIAAAVAANMGWLTEEHRADWSAPCREPCDHSGRRKNRGGRGDVCPAAGHYRNQHMVDLGAEVCVAFFQRGARNAGTIASRETIKAEGEVFTVNVPSAVAADVAGLITDPAVDPYAKSGMVTFVQDGDEVIVRVVEEGRTASVKALVMSVKVRDQS